MRSREVVEFEGLKEVLIGCDGVGDVRLSDGTQGMAFLMSL